MKRILTLASVVVALAACSPQAYVMRLEMRTPSSSGLDLDNKSMAVVYLDNGTYRDSLFNNCFADGLAQGLEKEYFEGKRSIDIYSAYQAEGEDYSSKDSLQSLVMRLNKDVIFLVDQPEFADGEGEKVDCKTEVYVYDSMNAKDEVKRASGATGIFRSKEDALARVMILNEFAPEDPRVKALFERARACVLGSTGNFTTVTDDMTVYLVNEQKLREMYSEKSGKAWNELVAQYRDRMLEKVFPAPDVPTIPTLLPAGILMSA